MQNYPNPFNPSTTIEFDIKNGETGTLTIFNLKGQVLVTKDFESGRHNYQWNANAYGTGVYFYKIQTGNIFQVQKMIMMK